MARSGSDDVQKNEDEKRGIKVFLVHGGDELWEVPVGFRLSYFGSEGLVLDVTGRGRPG